MFDDRQADQDFLIHEISFYETPTPKRTKPKVALTPIEFLCLKMWSHPCESKSFYLRALSDYIRGPRASAWAKFWGKQLFANFGHCFDLYVYETGTHSYTLSPTGAKIAQCAAKKLGIVLECDDSLGIP